MNIWKKRLLKLVRRINSLGLSKEKNTYAELVQKCQQYLPQVKVTELYLVIHSTAEDNNVFMGVQEGDKIHLINNLMRLHTVSTMDKEEEKYRLSEFKRAVIINHEQGYKLIIECPNPEGKILEVIEAMGSSVVAKHFCKY